MKRAARPALRGLQALSFLCFAASTALLAVALLHAATPGFLAMAAGAVLAESMAVLVVATFVAPQGARTPLSPTGHGIDISGLARRCPRWVRIVLPLPPACLALALAAFFLVPARVATDVPAGIAILGATFNVTTFAIFTGMLAPEPAPARRRAAKLPEWDWLAP